MLTIFHTADWHLGQSFCGYDRDYEHCCFLDWLLAQVKSQRPDALVVAGDVFDSINPSAVAQKRFYNFLANACTTSPGLQIVLIDRINFALADQHFHIQAVHHRSRAAVFDCCAELLEGFDRFFHRRTQVFVRGQVFFPVVAQHADFEPLD